MWLFTKKQFQERLPLSLSRKDRFVCLQQERACINQGEMKRTEYFVDFLLFNLFEYLQLLSAHQLSTKYLLISKMNLRKCFQHFSPTVSHRFGESCGWNIFQRLRDATATNDLSHSKPQLSLQIGICLFMVYFAGQIAW